MRGGRRGLDGAETVLTVRPVISNGDYPEEYRRFHLAREHQQLYPGTKQETIHTRHTSLQRSRTQINMAGRSPDGNGHIPRVNQSG